MSSLLLLPLGTVLGFAYGMVKKVRRRTGSRLKYAAMCSLHGFLAGGLGCGIWALIESYPQS